MEPLATVRNATEAAKQFASSEAGQLARIEGLVVVCCLLSSILVLGNSRRRHESRWFPRLVVWATFLFNYPVVAYTIGAMQSSSIQNELFVVWACFLILLLGSADCMTAFSFDDSSQQTRSMMNQGLHIVYLLLLILNYRGQLGHTLLVSLILLWALSTLRLGLRAWAYRSTSRSRGLIHENQVVADYMKSYVSYRSRRYSSRYITRYDPAPVAYRIFSNDDIKNLGIMNLSHYLVDGKEEKKRLFYGDVNYYRQTTVDVGRVWDCEGKLLADSMWRRDLCLSFALFKMLKLIRFGGSVDHNWLDKTSRRCDLKLVLRNFVVRGLLSSDDKRAFRVVEAALGFLFDFFYIRHPSIKDTLAAESILYAAILATSVFTLLSPSLVKYRPSPGDTNIFVHGFNLDLLISRMVIVCFIFIESYQFFAFFVFSNWHKVRLLCQYVRKWRKWPRLVYVPLKFLCHATSTKYWKGTLGQYSILQLEPHWFKRFLLWISLQSLEESLTTSSVSLHPETMKAVLRELKKCGGHIHNGLRVFHRSDDSPLPSPYLWEPVRIIVTFNVVTSICSYGLNKEKASEEVMKNHDVANQLSGYCAYLVAFQPELVSSAEVLSILGFVRAMIRKIRWALADANYRFDEDERYEKLIGILKYPRVGPKRDVGPETTYTESTYLLLAAEMAQYLHENYNEQLRWEVLASFWANMMLYISPSVRAVAHASKMASGGEFITILWALLTNAGILEVPISSDEGGHRDGMACAEEDDSKQSGEPTFVDIVKFCYPTEPPIRVAELGSPINEGAGGDDTENGGEIENDEMV